MKLDDLIMLQSANKLGDQHLVYMGPDGFRIAHTDYERSRVSSESLESCDLHRWLSELDEAPVEPGIYIATPHEPETRLLQRSAQVWVLEPYAT